MKRIFTFFLMTVIPVLNTFAGVIEKSYFFSNPQIENAGDFQKIKFPGTLLTNRAGDPALPYAAVTLLLPPGEKAVSIVVTGEMETTLKGKYRLSPYQPSRPLSDTSAVSFIINKKTYAKKTALPVNPAGRLRTAHMNGYAFALSAFTPVRYVPATGKVSYYQKVTVRIITAPDAGYSLQKKNLKTGISTRNRVRLLAQNPEIIKMYGSQQNRSMSDYRMLIITGDAYLNSFDSLRDIYLERGIRSKVYSVSYINNNISGQDVQEKIRNFIIQEYQNHSVEFVLLGGDVEIVPYRGFYCYVQSGGGYESNDIPADLYYSALDGTWNDDGDNRWGEPDEDDLLPDVSVARMPFSNADELASLIHKSVWYQNYPVLGEFTHPLLAGEFLYNNPETWGSDYLRLLIGTHSDNGYTTTGIPPDYDIDSMYERYQSWSGSDLINAVNQGKEFVHHVGHASQTYVAHLNNSDITDANFYAANGVTHNYTLLHTHGCDCGAFDYNDCILERMVNIHNFAAAVIGNSRYGWFNEGQTEGPAAHLHRETVDALFHDSLSMVGRALMEAKIATSPWVEAPGQWEEGALRWNFYDLNVLGDPAMAVWTDEPISVSVTCNSTIPIGTDSLQVHLESNGMPLHNYTCSVLKNEELIGYGFTDTLGNVTVYFDTLVTSPGSGMLVVSGYNCLPDTNDLTFVPSGTAYVIYEEHSINDSLGNGNGEADFGETIALNVALTNVGNSDAHEVVSQISTLNGNLLIVDDTAGYGTVAAGDTVWRNNAFLCTVADNVPDREEIVIQIQNDADEGSWTTDFSIIANAPVLSPANITVADTLSGNRDGDLDPGETALLLIPVTNTGHAQNDTATALLTVNSPYVTLENDTDTLGVLGVDSTKTALFQVAVSDETPVGTIVPVHLTITSGSYTFERDYTLSVGLLVEDFETGDFSKFEWQTTGAAPWSVTGENPFQGLWCAKSGPIDDYQHSDLFLVLTTVGDDTIRFVGKVSSEENYDFLNFYIDDQPVDSWSGEQDWFPVKYPLSEGSHTLKWSYEKDMSVSSGSDCAWLDSIVFPATTVAVNVQSNISNEKISLFPNPSKGKFTVTWNRVANAEITVFDITGRVIEQKKSAGGETSGTFDFTKKEKGIYLLRINLNGFVTTKKILIE